MGSLETFNLPRLEDTPDWEEKCRKYGHEVVTIVRFVSLISKDVTPDEAAGLATVDRNAEIAAMKTNKLKLYKKGERNAEGISDNECWWIDEEEARNVIHSPEHIEATRYMIEHAMYEDYFIEVYTVRHDENGNIIPTLSRFMTKEDLETHMSPVYASKETSVETEASLATVS